MVELPEDAPSPCPVCGHAYASVSIHREGLMVNLVENRRFHRVCFDPQEAGGEPAVYFYHHTHEQASGASAD